LEKAVFVSLNVLALLAESWNSGKLATLFSNSHKHTNIMRMKISEARMFRLNPQWNVRGAELAVNYQYSRTGGSAPRPSQE